MSVIDGEIFAGASSPSPISRHQPTTRSAESVNSYGEHPEIPWLAKPTGKFGKQSTPNRRPGEKLDAIGLPPVSGEVEFNHVSLAQVTK